jgi:hypothetical protein
VLLAVVDDDLQSLADLLRALDDLRQVEVVGHHPHLGLVLDGLAQNPNDGLARLEAHPGQRLLGLGMGGLEIEAIHGLGRDQLGDGAKFLEMIDERL